MTFLLALQIVGQTLVTLCFVLVGLKYVGRRAFGELGPQDFVLIMLLSESMDYGLMPTDSGFWGSIISGSTLLVTINAIDKIDVIRNWLDGKPLVLYSHGVLDEKLLKRENITIDDLASVARSYGYSSIEVFDEMTLETNGSITGVLKIKKSH